jgi:hypothetical protein
MPRGFSWMTYVTDSGQSFALRVDSDQALDPGRGWVEASIDMPVLPRGWRPRTVHGRDYGGIAHRTRVATLNAPLWTGSQITFTVEGTDLQLHTVIVSGRRNEKPSVVNRPLPSAQTIDWIADKLYEEYIAE